MSELPIESWGLYQLAWITLWWDWELKGIAQRDGKRVFFECVEEDAEGERKFAIYDPPAEVWARIDEEHKDFQTYVGEHWDFHLGEDGVCRRNKDTKRPEGESYKFYDKYRDNSIKMQPEWQIAIADSALQR